MTALVFSDEQKGEFFGMLLGTLDVSLLENILGNKGVKWPKSSNIPGQGVMKIGEGIIRAYESKLEQGRNFNATSSFN